MTHKKRMPAEWEPHRATWIAWPYLDSDFPGKVEAVRWAYCEFIRHVCKHECVEILCLNEELESDLRDRLTRQNIVGNIRIHRAAYDRSWLRDSGPIGVLDSLSKTPAMNWLQFTFNAWSALENFADDRHIPNLIADITKIPLTNPLRGGNPIVFEGGMIDVSGDGLILVTEECLLSEKQQRNPGFSKADYEEVFATELGITGTIWLPWGVAGDDTHGHIDNVARFVSPRTVVVTSADKSDAEQYERTSLNVAALKAYRTPTGEALTVIELPLPETRYCDGARLAAGYANFYIANGVVVVPTYNDVKDRTALGILAELFPTREVVGIHCGDWILGGGTLHCSTQQEPAV